MSGISPGPDAGSGKSHGSLRIYMLGPFECRHGDAAVPREAWRTRPTLSLFKLLLDERDRPVPVERLADAIWPDSDPAAARQSLQVAVRTIRLALEPDLSRGTDSRYIRTEPGAYRFDSSACTVDVDLFLAASQRALSDRSRDTAATIAACNEAVTLYRDEYLSDEPYSEWAFGTRERLRSRYLDVLDVLSVSLASAGDWNEASVWIERALALDPFQEALYRRLVRCQIAQGRRSHALVTLERCKTVLQRELGVEPSEETLRLFDEVSRQRPVEIGLQDSASAGLRPTTDLRLPFVGRGEEFATLTSAFSRARHEAGVLAAVSGPPGIGKSRLVQEFCERLNGGREDAAEVAPRVLWLHCHESEKSVPFAPLVRLLAAWLDQTPSVADRRRLEPHAPALLRLVPQARSLLAEEREVRASFEVGQLLEASTQAVRTMLRDTAGVIVVDDLQWADGNTLLWLSYLVHRLEFGVLTITTYRTAEDAATELGHFLSEARRSGKLIDIPLGPLELGALDDLVAGGLRDVDRRAELSRHLHRSTGGLPLFVVEMLRDLMTSGRLYVDDQGWWRLEQPSVPAGSAADVPGVALREIIQNRVDRLGPDALDAFRAICVIAAECRAALVASITGASLDVTLGALDELLERELIRVVAGGRGYVVEHPVVREVVYDGLGAARRQAWHLRVARGLRAVADDYALPPGQALHHLIAGDATLREIIDAAEQAGEMAMQRAAIADAIDFFGLALDRLRTLQPDPDARRRISRVRERRADAFVVAGQWDAAIEAFEVLQSTSEDRLGRARAMRKFASAIGDIRGQFEQSLEILDRAERELEGRAAGGDPNAENIERGRIDAVRTNTFFFMGEYQGVISFGARALAHWKGQAGVERDEIEQFIRIGNAEQRLGRLMDAETRYRTAVARAEMFGDRELEARSRAVLAGLYGVQGRLTDAKRMHEQTVEFGQEFGIPRLEVVGLTNTAVILGEFGELRAARDAYEQALERARELDAQYTVMHVLVGIGEVLVRLGDGERARDVLMQGIELSEQINAIQRRGHAYLHLGELALLEGYPSAAIEWLERGIATGAEIHDIHVEREGRHLVAQALIALGRAEDAEHEARRGLAAALNGGFRVSIGRNQRALAEALAAADNLPAAREALAKAEEIFRSVGAGYDLAATLLVCAAMASTDDDRKHLLDEALRLARKCSAGPLMRRIETAQPRSE